ncbi:MAG: hypothetical protein ACRCYQ_02015 [Nocardioides sp.]
MLRLGYLAGQVPASWRASVQANPRTPVEVRSSAVAKSVTIIVTSDRGITMALHFIGKDPNSPVNDSPTIYDNGDTYVVQGWRVVDPATVAELGDIPDHETVVEIPKRIMQFFPEVSVGS